ncbi:acetolactate synthase, large subunit [Rhizobiales bacterium GAS113]|nr:acetolactate synthase, large subunit [Rhizobiales bacterium GAS113]
MKRPDNKRAGNAKSARAKAVSAKSVSAKSVSTKPARNNAPISGGEAIVRSLIENGVDTVFGLPGAQMYSLFDALYQESGRITTYGARHEQGTAYMAFGYARSTGRPGVFSVVPGPGILNAAAAISTAWGCCAPVLCVTGQLPSEFIGRRRGHLHEIPDQLGTLRSLCKWAARIERPADTPRVMNEAFRQMLSGRPGPVAVEMAWDVMGKREQVVFDGPASIDQAPDPDPEAVLQAAKILVSAKRPMIMLGSGAQHAAKEVRALAEALDAPVSAMRGGRGIVSEADPLGVSAYAAYLLWEKTDALIAIGTRAEMAYMRWTGMTTLIDRPEAPPHLIRIDIDPEEMLRLKPHAGIVADSAAGARALLEAVQALKRPRRDNRKTIAAAKVKATKALSKVQPQVDYLDTIREVLPRDGFFVTELCQAGFTSYTSFPVYEPRTYVSEGFQGTLGAGFQTALGVKVAHPDKAVVSITGDGGFMFGVQELATAAQHDIGLVTVLFNNDSFGNVRRDQDTRFGGRVIGADLVNPDFMKLADSFGVAGYRVHSPAELKPVLARAIAAGKPCLIEAVVKKGSEVSPWEFLMTSGRAGQTAPPPRRRA